MHSHATRSSIFASWKTLLTWYAVSIVIGTLGSVLSYTVNGSDAWRWWAPGSDAWCFDAVRLVVLMAISLLGLWGMRVLPPERANVETSGPLRMPLKIPEKAILLVLAVTLLGFNFYVLPRNFVKDLVALRYMGSLGFSNICRPYFTYIFYLAALWIGSGWPVLLALIRLSQVDWKRFRSLWARLDRHFPWAPSATLEAMNKARLLRMQETLTEVTSHFKSVAERYLSVALTLGLALALPQLTAGRKTVTTEAFEWSKVVCWFLFGPGTAVLLFTATVGYETVLGRARRTFRLLSESLATRLAENSSEHDEELLTGVLAVQGDLLWNKSAASFIVEIVKSAGIAVPVLVILFAYILPEKALGERWEELFFPPQVRELLGQFVLPHSAAVRGVQGRPLVW